MPNTSALQQLINKIVDIMPPTTSQLQQDFTKALHANLQGFFAEYELATREELDIQSKVLIKTRLKVEQLIRKIEALEQERLEGS